MPASTDEEIVRDVLGGNSEAFAPLVAKYRRAALVCAMGVLGSVADAEDVAQESLVRAYTNLATCRDHARFGAWLMTIVRHTALNYVRSARRRQTVALDDTHEIAAEPQLAASEERTARVALLAAIQTLSASQREVLLLSDLQGLSHADIAARTGLSVLMSRRHLSDARRRVRGLLRNPHDQ